uniref:Tetraspanin n=1 Tax=Parascaris equorum TaxID=6256 RepID=A0A914RBH2_PAREQ
MQRIWIPCIPSLFCPLPLQLVSLLSNCAVISHNYVLDLVNFAEDEPLLRAAVYVSILTGCITLVVGFVACCGAIKKSRCMIVTLVIFLTAILCAEVTIGVLALCYRNKVRACFLF